jgi:hypothetical protein
MVEKYYWKITFTKLCTVEKFLLNNYRWRITVMFEGLCGKISIKE